MHLSSFRAARQRRSTVHSTVSVCLASIGEPSSMISGQGTSATFGLRIALWPPKDPTTNVSIPSGAGSAAHATSIETPLLMIALRCRPPRSVRRKTHNLRRRPRRTCSLGLTMKDGPCLDPQRGLMLNVADYAPPF